MGIVEPVAVNFSSAALFYDLFLSRAGTRTNFLDLQSLETLSFGRKLWKYQRSIVLVLGADLGRGWAARGRTPFKDSTPCQPKVPSLVLFKKSSFD